MRHMRYIMHLLEVGSAKIETPWGRAGAPKMSHTPSHLSHRLAKAAVHS